MHLNLKVICEKLLRNLRGTVGFILKTMFISWNLTIFRIFNRLWLILLIFWVSGIIFVLFYHSREFLSWLMLFKIFEVLWILTYILRKSFGGYILKIINLCKQFSMSKHDNFELIKIWREIFFLQGPIAIFFIDYNNLFEE